MTLRPRISKEALVALSAAAREEHSVFCLEQLGVPQRVINLLYDNGLKSMGDLLSKTPDQILAIPNLGDGQMGAVLDALSRYDRIEDL
jgi:DNA-directed RNA polymerase alpha subunit